MISIFPVTLEGYPGSVVTYKKNMNGENRMSDISIPGESIILRGIIQNIHLGSHMYIVYHNETDQKTKICICSDFWCNDDGTYGVEPAYTRGLCDTIEEFEKLTMAEIESDAYGAWMDGAR